MLHIDGIRPVVILALCGIAVGVAACVPFYTRMARVDLPPPPDAFGPAPASQDGEPHGRALAADPGDPAPSDDHDPPPNAPRRVEERLHALIDPAVAAVPKAFLDVKTGAMILSRSGRNVLEHMTERLGEAEPERSMAHLQFIDGARPLEVKPVAYARDWPEAVSFQAGDYEVEFSPHASLRIVQDVTEAEAGGMLRVWRSPTGGKEVDVLGVSSEHDARSPKAQRWYLFLGASGRTVDWRAIRNTGGGDRWAASSDAATVFLQTAQAGFAWRRGALQTAVAFVMRQATSGGPFTDIYPGREQIVALSVSLRPMKSRH